MFWSKARIPTRAFSHCQAKLEKEFEAWQLLKKNSARATTTQKTNETVFTSKLDDLFDIAHVDALKLITISEDREFLLAQREKGRRGTMAGLDTTLMKKEKRASQKRDKLVVKEIKQSLQSDGDGEGSVSLQQQQLLFWL